MNSLQRKVALKQRKKAFLDRNKDRMRKKQILTWVSGDCLVPEWIVSEIGYGRLSNSAVRQRVIELVNIGIDRSAGLPKLRRAEDDNSIEIKIRLGGEVARAIKAWAGKRRVKVGDAIVELMIWGTM